MSAYYYLYTAYYDEEKGEYKRIDPYFRNKEGKLVQTELVWSGSRSYFSDTWDKLNEIANDTYSKEIKGIKGLNLADFRDEETDYGTYLHRSHDTWFTLCRHRIGRRHRKHGRHPGKPGILCTGRSFGP